MPKRNLRLTSKKKFWSRMSHLVAVVDAVVVVAIRAVVAEHPVVVVVA